MHETQVKRRQNEAVVALLYPLEWSDWAEALKILGARSRSLDW